MHLRRRLLVILGCAMVVAAHSADGQSTARGAPIPTTTYIGINPVGLPFDIGTFEIESGVAPGVTIGGVASYIDVGDPRFTTGEFKVRYYPSEIVLRGISIGATAGVTRFSNKVDGGLVLEGGVPVPASDRQTLTAPTLGIIVDYNWLFGREEHFLIGTGIGAKRVLASTAERDRADIDRAIFTVRLIVGYAF